MASGANGLVLGQLTGTPGISTSEAGSGHGSARRDQLTAAAIAHKVKLMRKTADNPQAACFLAALLAMTTPWLSLRPQRRNRLASRASTSSIHSVFLKTA